MKHVSAFRFCYASLPFLLTFFSGFLSSAQTFQRIYGTSVDNSFTKVIQDGTHYYVLGQDLPSGSTNPHATVTRLDANGIQLWTLSLNIPSLWNDAVLTPGGDLLVVGATAPFDATNQSLMGLVTSSGGGNFTWLKSYDVPGREGHWRIVRNPNPENPSFPYYVLGGQYDPSNASPLWDDIFLLTMNSSGTINWKKYFPKTDDDEFARDLEVTSNGDLLICGNTGTQGVILRLDHSGALINGVSPDGISFSYADVAQETNGGFYAVGSTFPSFQAHLMKYDNNLLSVWDATLSALSGISQVWQDQSNGDIYVTGRGTFHGINRAVVLRLTDAGNTPTLQWVKFLDRGETSYAGGLTTYLSSGQIAFADGRVPSSGGFGGQDAFISISDLDMQSCMTMEDFLNVDAVSLTYNAPFIPAMEFYDFSIGADLNASAINWSQEEVCQQPCQADFVVLPVGACGQYEVFSTSTGVEPLSYAWCDGATSENFTITLPCGPHTFCLTVTADNGCTSTFSQTITVSDTIPPVAVCVPPFSVVMDANCDASLTPAMIDGGSTDNCQIQSLSIDPSVLHGCGFFPVTLTVTDWCGNTSTCTTTVQTHEDIPPVILCPSSVVVTVPTGSPCSTVVNGLSWISATDNCGTPFVDYVVTGATSNFGQNDASGLVYNEGVSNITYTATDPCGNTSSCSFTVTVQCVTPCDSLFINLNTGWDNQNSTVLPILSLDQDGAPDLDWIITADPLNPPPPGGRPADVTGMYVVGWTSPFPNSEWISMSPNWYESQLPNPPYLFTNEITFDLPTGYTNPGIALQMRADELIHTVSLNNNVIYQFFPPQVSGGFNGPPLIVHNYTPGFFQTTQNKLSVSYSDESGGVTGFNLAGSVSYCMDSCVCGTFSDMVIRFERGPGQPLTCGGPPVLIECPPPGYSYTISGKFECQGNACPSNTPFDAQLELPTGTIIHYQGQSASPYFGIPISNLDLQQAGIYTVTFTGHCGTQECKCVIRFQIDTPCIDLCPCEIPDIQAFGAAVNQGFAQVLYTKSCKACFTPIALDDCATVDWYLTNTTGTPIGSSVGNNSFCYLFPGSGTYTVIMVATRKKPDGSNCETFVKSQTVTITCLVWDDCSASVWSNPSFGEGAVKGDLDAGGSSTGWKKMKPSQPKTEADKRTGSQDGWVIDLEGNLESSGILTRTDPVCIERDSGFITLSIAVSDSGVQVAKKAPERPCDRLQMRLYRGDNFDIDITNCNGVDCYELASIPLSDLDTGWHELQIPYNLRNWLAQDDCGSSDAVLIRPAVYVTNALMNNQGGEDTYSHAQLDNFCFGGMIVDVKDPPPVKDFEIYPNPNEGDFTVRLPGPAPQGMSLIITNTTGQVLFEHKIDPGSIMHTLELQGWTKGIYFLQIRSSGQMISVKKFVVQ